MGALVHARWRPAHSLDALFFLKVHGTEQINSTFSGRDTESLQKWNWHMIEAIANVEGWISWENGFKCDNGLI